MQLELAPEDRELLISLIESTLGDLRSEVRRTRNPQFHDDLVRQERRLEALLEQLRKLA